MSGPRTITDNVIGFSPVIGEAHGICGALILQQIHYWVTGQSAQIKHGHFWVYNAHKEWAKQLRVYTDKTIRDKLTQLESLGIVVTGVYNRRANDRTKWYRINYQCLAESLMAYFPGSTVECVDSYHAPRLIITLPNDNEEEENLPIHVELFSTHVEENHPPLPQTTAETNKETMVKPPTESSLPPGKNKIAVTEVTSTVVTIKKQSLGEVKMSKQPTSSAAILAAMQKKKTGVSTLPANTTKSMKGLWQELVPQHHPSVGMMVELTLKKQGQLGAIAKTWGLTADRNLAHVIKNWVGYTKFVAAQKGLKLTPDVPDIGFIQKYVGEAGAFVTQAMQLTALTPKIKLVHKPASVEVSLLRPPVPTKKVLEAGEEEASLEDVLAWKKTKE